jgi:hypothetical protein
VISTTAPTTVSWRYSERSNNEVPSLAQLNFFHGRMVRSSLSVSNPIVITMYDSFNCTSTLIGVFNPS